MHGVSSRYFPDPTPRMAKPLRLGQMGLARAQFFLRPFALGDVDHGAYEFNQIAGWAENGMAHHVDVSNLAAGMNDSITQLELRLLAARCLSCFPNFGLIIRMDALKECFESRFSTVRVKTQHAVAFLGPVPNVTRSRDPCPTARVAQALRFGQESLAAVQGRSGGARSRLAGPGMLLVVQPLICGCHGYLVPTNPSVFPPVATKNPTICPRSLMPLIEVVPTPSGSSTDVKCPS